MDLRKGRGGIWCDAYPLPRLKGIWDQCIRAYCLYDIASVTIATRSWRQRLAQLLSPCRTLMRRVRTEMKHRHLAGTRPILDTGGMRLLYRVWDAKYLLSERKPRFCAKFADAVHTRFFTPNPADAMRTKEGHTPDADLTKAIPRQALKRRAMVDVSTSCHTE